MANPIETSASGRITIPDMIYQGGKVEVIDPETVARSCQVLRDQLADHMRQLVRNINTYQDIVDGKGEYTDAERASAGKILDQNWKLYNKVESARIWNNKFIKAIGPVKTRKANSLVVVECPEMLAEVLFNIRPANPENPNEYREFFGWWNFDALRLDNTAPHHYDIYGDGW